jgi:NDP-sugar pyrophosphorylase family protein
MIVAAGLGTRMRPLTTLRPKPAVPVRGIPLVAYPLAFLRAAGVREVAINVHHLPEALMAAAERWAPPGLRLRFSLERELLHTGGGIRRVADFLRESDPCLVLGGDMLFDLDAAALLAAHRASGRAVTAVLRRDERAARFGTIGLDACGRLRRIGRRFDLGGEERAGVYTWVNVLSPRAFDSMPDREVFNHLEEWWGPAAQRGEAIGGVVLEPEACAWEPVGNLPEYLSANLAPPKLRYLDTDAVARAAGARIEGDVVIGAGAAVPASARLARSVVWDGERVPEGFTGAGGVFAGGAFHACEEVAAS